MKVGILTLFYHNYNYGGCLQAYALSRILNEKGYHAKQISYDILQGHDPRLYELSCKFKRSDFSGKLIIGAKILVNLFRMYKRNLDMFPYRNKMYSRNKCFDDFSDEYIPHTPEYSEKTIADIDKIFDVFICGSDQIWNPFYIGISTHFFLDFTSKRKVSYAASVSRNNIDSSIINKYQHYLKSFMAVSVREKTAKELLCQILENKIEVVLDPTLLLTADQWNDILDKNYEKSEYIFCYFLGEKKWHRKYAEDISRKTGIKLLSIPFGQERYKAIDLDFKTCFLWDIGPSQFIEYIKGAKYILTDSFHACVFSMIFHKHFGVMNRNDDNGTTSMNSRIDDFLKMFHLEKCLIESVESCVDINRDINYEYSDTVLEIMREESIQFLINSLNTD